MSRRKKILIGGAAALAIVVGLGVVHHFRVKGAVERYKAELRAAGELLDWDQIVPAPLRSEENSAGLFNRVSAQLPQTGALATNNPHGMMMVAHGKATTGWAQPWVGGLGYDYSNSWAEVIADYEIQRDLLVELQALIAQPGIDHHLDYSQGAILLLPHLAGTKQCAQRIGAAAACESHLSNPQQALLHARTMVALAKGSAREPVLITQLVRIAIVSMAGATTWDLLQTSGLNDAGLAALQEDWSGLEVFASMEPTLLMERSISLMTMELMRGSSEGFQQATSLTGGLFPGPGGAGVTSGSFFQRCWEMVKDSLSRFKTGVAEGAWRTSWSYTDELSMLKGHQAYLEVIRLAAAERFASNALQLAQKLKQEGRIPKDSGSFTLFGQVDAAAIRSMFSDGVSIDEKYFIKALKAEANARMAVAAIALERYRRRHGAYPETLHALVPEITPSVPRDPMDGEPLRYQALPDGSYLLYSIGEDLVDDGGNPLPQDWESHHRSLWWMFGRDWVWPQAASPVDVQAYWKAEIDENFYHLTGLHLPQPVYLMDTNTGLPAIDPETWEYVLDPSATNVPAGDTVELSEQEWQNFVHRLARQWTDQYFRTLMNGSATVEEAN